MAPRIYEPKLGEFIQEHETKPGLLTPSAPVRVDLMRKRTSGQIKKTPEKSSQEEKHPSDHIITVSKHQNSPAPSPSLFAGTF